MADYAGRQNTGSGPCSSGSATASLERFACLGAKVHKKVMNFVRMTVGLIASFLVGCVSSPQVTSAPASYYEAPAAVTAANPYYVPVFVPGVITAPQSVYGSTAVTSYEPVVLPAPVYGAVAENGSYYGQPNVNGVPKTVAVGGYYRKDGTYVRGHYRSSPGSNPPSTRRRR